MDYFFRLAQRALNTPGQLLAQPRLPSRYELGDAIVRPESLAAQADTSEQRQAAPASTTLARSDAAAARLAPLPAPRVEPTHAPVLPSLVTESPSLFSQHATPTVATFGELSGRAVPPEPARVADRPVSVTPSAPAPLQPAPVRPVVSALRPAAERQSTGVTAIDRTQLELDQPSDVAPSIRVTIGRIDVRAVMPPAPPARRAPAAPKPAQALEDYLRAGKGGSSKP